MENIAIDMYGVIIEESKGNFIPYVYEHFPNTNRQFLVQRFTAAGDGEISSDHFLSDLGFSEPQEHMKNYLENYLTMDPDAINVLSALSSNYQLYLISNDVFEWNEYLMSYYGLNKFFQGKTVSAEVKCRKPGKEIFNIFLQENQISANSCFFIDNSVRNIQTANTFGFKSILFNRDNEEYNGTIVNNFRELLELLTQEKNNDT